MRKNMLILLGATCLVGGAIPTFAQTVSPQFDPARVEEQVPTDFIQSKKRFRQEIPLLEGLPNKETVEKDSSGISFKVDHIVVNNNTVFSESQIRSNLQGAIGDDITLTDLRQAAANITNMYRDAGYPFSRAFIPRQTLENNVVYIEILEGYVGDVELRGVSAENHPAIKLYAEELKKKRPVKQTDLERYTLLVNDLFGIQAKTVLSLMENDPGAVQVIFLIDEVKNETGAFINNRGSHALGPYQATAYYNLNNLLGQNEQTNLIYLTTPGTSELRYMSLSQSWPIGPYGTRISYSLRRSDSEPGKEAKLFDIKGYSNSAEVSVSHPWVRSREQNLSTTFSLDARNSKTESFGTEIIDDKLRHVRLGTSYNLIHWGGLTSIDATISKGLGIFDYTKKGDLMASRLGASADSSKLQAHIKRYQPLFENAALTVRASGQWAFHPLLSSELFGIGGTDYGRAFDFSAITGDSGYAASAELSYAIPTGLKDINNLSVYSFIDGGNVYDEASLVGDNWKGLYSTGIGLDISTHNILNARLELARPIKIDADLEDDGLQAYGSVGVRFKF